MNNKWIYFLLGSIAFTPTIMHAAPTPKFSILPTTKTTLQISSTSTATVRYQITNNTKIKRTLTFKAIQGVSQGTGGTNPCSSPFTLDSKQSCLLTLVIHGNSISSAGIHSGPEICKTQGPGNNNPDPYLCSQPSTENHLNITLSPSSLIRRLIVGVATINGQNAPIAFTSTDGGNSWSSLIQLSSTLPSTLSDVFCDDSGLNCVSVGRTTSAPSQPLAYNTTDGGNSWSSPILLTAPAGATDARLISVACDSAAVNCVAVGRSRTPTRSFALTYTSMDGGATWSTPVLPTALTGSTTLLGVACSSSGLQCVTVGVNGAKTIAYTSNDGGKDWNAPSTLNTPPSSTPTLSAVSCNSSGLICSAVGNTFDALGNQIPLTYTTADGGLNWSNPILPTPPSTEGSSLSAVSCNDSGLCTAVGTGTLNGILRNLVYTSTDSGNTWSAPILPNIPQGFDANTLNGLFCGGNGTLCTTAGSGTTNAVNIIPYSYSSTDGGNTWSAPLLLPVPSSITIANVSGVSGSK
ncbi:BNR/Asp-box repeat containing protein [Legionella steigerwaltii]|uniref:BNR/Asp-box repeat containing protein n=1 Tax=Legionella steigerwaltii TaxID=460 RepID=A0A378LF81_9GAMM|nr:sialidase family protein [Legionella steigerwaltii]KTD79151.1 BNR/Asp-box repeat containing protein [Legionella steigerwaltii]STY22741.1 BNR/Asp-box repeat containing protein [Legionella steigerwaltii]